MAILSPEVIDNLVSIIELNGKVVLRCDGYRVDLCIGELTYFHPHKTIDVVQVYVNGEINVKWCNYGCEESKFLQPVIVDGDKTLYQPSFFTARAALEYINGASNNVELLLTQNSAQWQRKAG